MQKELDIRCVSVTSLPKNWKCKRCYKYERECSEWGEYNVCYRCQDVLSKYSNHVCCGCNSLDAVDNLCEECRVKRIAQYDERVMKKCHNSQPA